jgi:hypothetical protein
MTTCDMCCGPLWSFFAFVMGEIDKIKVEMNEQDREYELLAKSMFRNMPLRKDTLLFCDKCQKSPHSYKWTGIECAYVSCKKVICANCASNMPKGAWFCSEKCARKGAKIQALLQNTQ